MSESLPPARVVRMLEALGADPEFRDGVIGDLAEELTLRARWDGPGAARRWYYRESLRVAPYLLRNWWERLSRRDVRQLANVVGVSLVCTLTLQSFVLLSLGTTGMAAGMGRPPVLLIATLSVVLRLLAGGFSGYLAASLGRSARLASALAMAAGWVALFGGANLVSSLLSGPAIPLWTRMLSLSIFAGATIAGGLLRASRAGHEEGTLAG